eukprot:CAMPEP_0181375932 /NCGR_PEP_ID=MMETSP1106-20121128/17017_1 /TAXON_ID=81844 /ORGANISM="Mantoniella antarctica, Strain SL-175" /LENGTH=123 /DNA_ID=CAMNT_0023494413 /DNA_START=407 /DNA_END=775 /DNA_ORIENTATION=+
MASHASSQRPSSAREAACASDAAATALPCCDRITAANIPGPRLPPPSVFFVPPFPSPAAAPSISAVSNEPAATASPTLSPPLSLSSPPLPPPCSLLSTPPHAAIAACWRASSTRRRVSSAAPW